MSYVAINNNICPICGKEEEQILLDKKLRDDAFNKMTIDSSYLCENCSKHIDNGMVALIGIDPSKSGNANNNLIKAEEAYRTGKFLFIKREAVGNMINFSIGDHYILFCDQKVIDDLIEKYKEVSG